MVELTVSGERRRSLALALGVQARAFAVCDGFGTVEGSRIEEVALRYLRDALSQRARGPRFGYHLSRPKAMSSLLISVFSRINTELYVRSASHDDYVTAGASLTLVVLAGERAFLAHVGNTAAYLSRGGYMIALTKDDACAFDAPVGRAVAVSAHPPVLTRALGSAPSVELSVCSFRVSPTDALVLSNKRLAGFEDRRALSAWLLRGQPPFDLADRTIAVIPVQSEPAACVAPESRAPHVLPALAGLAVGIWLFLLASLP